MQADFSVPIRDLRGDLPKQKDDETGEARPVEIPLAGHVVDALMGLAEERHGEGPRAGHYKRDGAERIKLFTLSQKIVAADGPVEMSTKQAGLVREAAERFLTTLVFAQVLAALGDGEAVEAQ